MTIIAKAHAAHSVLQLEVEDAGDAFLSNSEVGFLRKDIQFDLEVFLLKHPFCGILVTTRSDARHDRVWFVQPDLGVSASKNRLKWSLHIDTALEFIFDIAVVGNLRTTIKQI